MSSDALLTDDFDIQLGADGDVLTAESFDTMLLMLLFCEKRATASEVPASHMRRGWVGNESTPGFEVGSKLWLYEQSRVTKSLLLDIETAALDGLKPMLDEGFATKLEASASLQGGSVVLDLTVYRPNSSVDKRHFVLWNNTGAN